MKALCEMKGERSIYFGTFNEYLFLDLTWQALLALMECHCYYCYYYKGRNKVV